MSLGNPRWSSACPRRGAARCDVDCVRGYVGPRAASLVEYLRGVWRADNNIFCSLVILLLTRRRPPLLMAENEVQALLGNPVSGEETKIHAGPRGHRSRNPVAMPIREGSSKPVAVVAACWAGDAGEHRSSRCRWTTFYLRDRRPGRLEPDLGPAFRRVSRSLRRRGPGCCQREEARRR